MSVHSNNQAVLRAAMVYMVTGFSIFLLMIVFGLILRLNHAGFINISLSDFYRIMTLHGIANISALLIAGMGGVAAILSKWVRINAKLLWIIYIIYQVGALMVIISTLIGGFAAGWTMLYPLPFMPTGAWNLTATMTFMTGVLFVALSFLIYCLMIIRATTSKYGGLSKALAWRYLASLGRDKSHELPRPPELLATAVAVIGVIAVLAGAILLLLLYAYGFNLIDWVDALLAKNLLFLFGHTVANLTMYLAAVFVYFTLPVYTGREWKTTLPVVLAVNLAILFVLTAYLHHLFQDFVQLLPLHLLGQFGSYGASIAILVVTVLGALSLIYRSGITWSAPSILIALGIWGWVFGGIGAVIDATIGINQLFHNTLWVPAHFHTYTLIGAAAYAWAFLYHMVCKLSGSSAGGGVRNAFAWMYGIGGGGFIFMFFVSGALGIPRRFAIHNPEWQIYAAISIPFIVMVIASIYILGADIFRRLKSAWRGVLSNQL